MRRFHLILIGILFVLVLNLFAVNFDAAVNNFKTLVNEYENGESRYKQEFDYMSVYKKYSLDIVGGVKNDSHYYDLDILLEDLYNNSTSGNPTEDISLAAFFAYVSSDLFDNSFDITVLNSFPPYYKSFSNYVQEIKDYSSDYFAQWIGYAIGLVSEMPDDLFDVEKSATRLRLRLKLDYEQDPELMAIIEDNTNEDIHNRLDTAIKNVKNDLKKNDDEKSVERSIKKNSLYVFAEVIEEINKEKEIISDGFIKNSPSSFNIWLLRFVVYLLILMLFIRNKKLLPYIFASIVIFDALYLFLTGNLILSDVEALIYGTIAVMTFCFAIIMYLSKIFRKRYDKNTFLVSTLLIAVIGLLYFVPVFSSPETLLMDNIEGFYSSTSYEALKDDLFIWEHSYLNDVFVEYDNSNISLEKADDLLTERYNHVVKYSGTLLKSEIDQYLNSKIALEKYSSFDDLKAAIASEVNPAAPSIMLYNTLTGSVIIMYLTFLAAIIIISGNSFVLGTVNLVVMAFLTLWFIFRGIFSGTFTFIIEKGFPLISNQRVAPNYLLLFSCLILLLICLLLIVKGRNNKKVS
ncbi:MAG TPA: hypothetical protein PK466_06515 [Thermotogota bacterium]|nr:hypothetical protein [Thermotogota bacterium]